MNKLLLIFGLVLAIFLSSCTAKLEEKNKEMPVFEQPEYIPKQIESGISRGNLPPDFTISTVDGKNYTISKLRRENKPILLYFWASWCPYCSEDFGIVKSIYPDYSDKVTFLAIDLDLTEKSNHIKRYKEAKGLEGIDFAEGKESILSDYGIILTTTKYAIGKNGTILYRGSGVFSEEQWKILLSGLADS